MNVLYAASADHFLGALDRGRDLVGSFHVIDLDVDHSEADADFVVEVLETFFSMNREQATRVMLTVHTRGKAVCGVYPQDIAETKATQVVDYAREHQHPLMCQVEKA